MTGLGFFRDVEYHFVMRRGGRHRRGFVMFGATAVAVVAASLLPVGSSADTGTFDLAVYLQSWAFVSDGDANVEAVWRVENHGPATEVDAEALLSLASPGLAFVPPQPPTALYLGFTVPPLASGATYTITTRVHADDTSAFTVQMHVLIRGALDSSTANNDAFLQHRTSGGSGGGGAAPAPVGPSQPAVKFDVPELALVAARGRCGAVPPDVPIHLEMPGNPNDYAYSWSIVYPDGATDTLWPSYRSEDGVFPVGGSSVSVAFWVRAIPSLRAEDRMTVVVRDQQSPRFTRVPKVVTAVAKTATGGRVFLPRPRVVDNCPGTTVTMKPRSGSRFPIGTTTVMFTATDASGNTRTATTKVVVTRAKQTG